MTVALFRETEVGRIGIGMAGDVITHLWLSGETPDAAVRAEETPLLKEAFRQLTQYLEGQRREFDLPLAPEGTPFMRRVWDALLQVTYGTTATYGEIAARIGVPRAARAVGMANHRNPISIFIPCHRVIGASGKLVGYGGGLALKRRLLALEGVRCEN